MLKLLEEKLWKLERNIKNANFELNVLEEDMVAGRRLKSDECMRKTLMKAIRRYRILFFEGIKKRALHQLLHNRAEMQRRFQRAQADV